MAQKSAVILIGKEENRVNLFHAVEDLKAKNGPELTSLLRSAHCSNKEGEYCTCKEFL